MDHVARRPPGELRNSPHLGKTRASTATSSARRPSLGSLHLTLPRCYFLRGGTVTVFAAGIEVNTINKGEYFGESGILSHSAQSGAPPHVESVACVASTPLDLYVMEPINYSLVGARVLGRLRRNWKVRASWRRTRSYSTEEQEHRARSCAWQQQHASSKTWPSRASRATRT